MTSKRALILTAGIVGSSLVMPAATADVAGCTETFVAAASSPSSDAGPVVEFNPKAILGPDGIHVYPSEGAEYASDVATHEANAVRAYASCI